jgi:hypothetical protein
VTKPLSRGEKMFNKAIATLIKRYEKKLKGA